MKKYRGNRKAQRKRRYEKGKLLRAAWIESQGGKCKCGSTDRLQVDHVNPESKSKILIGNEARIWIWSKERREKELLLCQLLCHRCHVKKSTVEQRIYPEHSRSGYRRGCRCRICKDDKNLEKRERNKRKKFQKLVSVKRGVTLISSPENPPPATPVPLPSRHIDRNKTPQDKQAGE